MAIYWLLSFVCLLASTAAAQDHSGGNIMDATATKSVTETVTKYLSQCSITFTPFEPPTTTLSGTTTVTSTLQSTISVTVANVTNATSVGPIGLTTIQPTINYTVFSSYSAAGTGGYPYPMANSSTPPANTTKVPCSTATVTVTPLSSSISHSITPVHGSSSTAAASVSPTQIPVSESSTMGYDTIMRNVVGLLGIALMLTVGFL
ncbi:uncharacterized protein F4807DRAFT_461587 [Annulohypoxylon truncatum]|uniref:uncharacterized protein n=1 Tax=Annulohypoxylon truncatum TaxID=327061 RepID=UPI002008B076|nr:uncharacterized protein F4807DRAFT_461587 [Annulohypoxylon truncatum]KAI1208651.1 hypothetical protein F4807DRAFT_461587 [Annulohypoxylon truncatum]